MSDIRKEVEKYVIENSPSIIGLSIMSREDFEHIVDISVSIVNSRDGRIQGGSFVQAVINNDLESAITRADSVCLRALKVLVLVKLWCHPV